MTFGDFLAYLSARGVRIRRVEQLLGQSYKDVLHLLDRQTDEGTRSSNIAGEASVELEQEIIDRVCRQLGLPRP